METLKDFFRIHILIVIYAIIVLILIYGSYLTSEGKHLNKIIIHGASAIGFYLIYYYLNNKYFHKSFNKVLNKLHLGQNFVYMLAILSVIQIVTHFINLGGSPAIEAFSLFTTEEVSDLRNNITANSSTLTNYLSSINLRGVIPFLILYFLLKKDYKFYYLLLIIGVIYSLSLMQKSYIVTIILPTLIYCSLKFKWLYMIKHTFIIGASVILLVYVASPTPTQNIKPLSEKNMFRSDVPLLNVLYGIQKRMFEVPGEIASEWFDNIPENKPFLNGDGYQFLTIIRGTKYIDYAAELYPIIRPNYAEQGYTGTVNTASFVYDYSNFGIFGLILGGFFISTFIFFIEIIFENNLLFKLSLNLFPISLLSSAAITTLAFSGGWLFLIFFYLVFLRTQKNSD